MTDSDAGDTPDDSKSGGDDQKTLSDVFSTESQDTSESDEDTVETVDEQQSLSDVAGSTDTTEPDEVRDSVDDGKGDAQLSSDEQSGAESSDDRSGNSPGAEESPASTNPDSQADREERLKTAQRTLHAKSETELTVKNLPALYREVAEDVYKRVRAGAQDFDLAASVRFTWDEITPESSAPAPEKALAFSLILVLSFSVLMFFGALLF